MRVARATDVNLAGNFKNEFERVLQEHLSQGPEIFLIDMLEDLKFLDPNAMGKCFDRVNDMLSYRKISLTLDQEKMTYTMFRQATENLFRLGLGILNINSKQDQEGTPIDDYVLRDCLG